MKNRKFSIAQSLSAEVAARYAAYFDGNTLHPLDDDKHKHAKILILSKNTYREVRATYPIKATKELLSLLRQKEPVNQRCMHFIGNWQNSQRQVLTIILNAGLEQILAKAYVVVPETIPMAYLLDDNLTEVSTPVSTLYMARNLSASSADRKNRLFNYQVAMKGGVIKNIESAQLALGVAQGGDITYIDKQVYFNLLSLNLFTLPLSSFPQFLIKTTTPKRPFPVTEVALVTVAVGCLYLGGSWVYLTTLESHRSAQLAEFGSEVTQRLNERQAREQELEKLAALSYRPVSVDAVLANYDVLAFFLQQNFELADFRGNFDTLEVRGQAASATNLVTEMNNLIQVRNIEFTAPVRRAQGGEVFSIEVTINSSWRAETTPEVVNQESALPEADTNG